MRTFEHKEHQPVTRSSFRSIDSTSTSFRETAKSEGSASAPKAGHHLARIKILPVQTKLQVNTVGDVFEQEAERVADQVMRMPTPAPEGHSPIVRANASPHGGVQRLAAHVSSSQDDAVIQKEDEGEPQTEVQTLREPVAEGGTAQLPATRLAGTGGQALESGARQFLEPRFGADFSRVRIHADQDSARLSNSLNARAFTHGAHIYFAAGEYRPESTEGRHVLAHELTHVIQQGEACSGLSRQDAGAAGHIQRLSARGKKVADDVYPWGPPGPVGADYEAKTDAGSSLTVWDAYPIFREEYTYWCHGHSLDSHRRFAYSVYSGSPMATVIADEWKSVPPDKTQVEDIAVWTSGWNHSAKFVNPVFAGGHLDPAASELSTKNGQAALTTMTLSAIAGIYGGTGIGVYRHR